MTKDGQNQILSMGRIIIQISILLVAVALAWGTLRSSVKENVKDIEKNDARIVANQRGVSEVKSDIREIKVEQRYISEGIKEIKEAVK